MDELFDITEEYNHKKHEITYIVSLCRDLDKIGMDFLKQCVVTYNGRYVCRGRLKGSFVFQSEEEAMTFAQSMSYYFEDPEDVEEDVEEEDDEITDEELPMPALPAMAAGGQGQHLEFKGIEICGHPQDFVMKLSEKGFRGENWCSEYVTMKGIFAGVANCEVYVYFYIGHEIVYKVKVEFPLRDDEERVIDDYNKLLDALTKLYGKPRLRKDEIPPRDWHAKFNTPKGEIKMECALDMFPRVTLEYIDGYYDRHLGMVDPDIAMLDL